MIIALFLFFFWPKNAFLSFSEEEKKSRFVKMFSDFRILFYVFLFIQYGFFSWVYRDFMFYFYFNSFISPKISRLIIQVTQVTTEHQKLPKNCRNIIISHFWPKGHNKPRPKAIELRKSQKFARVAGLTFQYSK